MQPQSILDFWFTELTPKHHFAKDAALDETICTRFSVTLEAAARCELFAWRATPEGRLAEILVLYQFSRNVYRDTPRAFAQDALALALAQELVASGQDRSLPLAQLGLEDPRAAPPSHHPALWPLPPPQRDSGPRVHARGAGVFE
jgi:uncharacterized protein (DUF924 family)